MCESDSLLDVCIQVGRRTFVALLLCGFLFSVLLGPLIATLTLYSSQRGTLMAFMGYAFYGVLCGIPLVVVFSMVASTLNGILIAAIRQFLRVDDFQRYRSVTLASSSLAGLIMVPLLLILLTFDLRTIHHEAWLFIGISMVIVSVANQWAVRRYLGWYRNQMTYFLPA